MKSENNACLGLALFYFIILSVILNKACEMTSINAILNM